MARIVSCLECNQRKGIKGVFGGYRWRETGREDFFRAAKNHFYTTIDNAIRENGSAYQNVYFDPSTGEVTGKGTKQGVSDEACWSRGQAWVLYGLPLSYAQLKDSKILDVHQKAVEYFYLCDTSILLGRSAGRYIFERNKLTRHHPHLLPKQPAKIRNILKP